MAFAVVASAAVASASAAAASASAASSATAAAVTAENLEALKGPQTPAPAEVYAYVSYWLEAWADLWPFEEVRQELQTWLSMLK